MRELVGLACIGVVAVAAAVSSTGASAQEEPEADARAATLAEVRTLLAEGDTFAAAEHIQRDGTVEEVVDRYVGVVDDLYWKERDLPSCMVVGRAAVLYALSRAQESEDDAARRALRVAAQELSFNLASYAWPGWDEKGIEIGAAELAAGLDCARLDLRLVFELRYPAQKHANAHWIVGAQLLAAGRHAEALDAFEASRSNARKAGDATKGWMADGYAGIARALLSPDEDSGREQVAAARRELTELGTDDATYLAAQLEDVLRIFATE